MYKGSNTKEIGILLVLLSLICFVLLNFVFSVRTDDKNKESLLMTLKEGDTLAILPWVSDTNSFLLLSVEEAEQLFGIEILIPTIDELQYWCIRKHVDVNMPTRGFWDDRTAKGIDRVRSEQEASRWYPVFKVGEPNALEQLHLWIKLNHKQGVMYGHGRIQRK